MFNVTRSIRPATWTSKNYRDEIVVSQLKKDFFSKCYLCEQANIGAVNVEHLIPHQGKNEELRIEWDNLYYCCSHCNSIKGSRFSNILDCCNAEHKVDKALALELPYLIHDVIKVENILNASSPYFELGNQTANLIYQCYNNANSGVQKVNSNELRGKLFNEYSYFQMLRFKLTKDPLRIEPSLKESLIKQLANIVKPHYPFSAFWRHAIKHDVYLLETLPQNFLETEFV